MQHGVWCEHLDKRSKITVVDYRCLEKVIALKIQSWYCPECGVYGAETELNQIEDTDAVKQRQQPNEPVAAYEQVPN